MRTPSRPNPRVFPSPLAETPRSKPRSVNARGNHASSGDRRPDAKASTSLGLTGAPHRDLVRDNMSLWTNRAEISAKAILHNLARLRAAAPGCEVCAVVKANGYGLGAEACATVLALRGGVRHFGVATLDEAVQLRAAGIRGTILLLGGAAWWSEPGLLLDAEVTPLIASVDEVAALSEHLRTRSDDKILDVHLAVDTGLGREGALLLDGNSQPDFARLIDAVAGAPHIRAVGIMSHFANADLADSAFTTRQIDRFAAALRRASAELPIKVAHLTNSAATLTMGARPGPLAHAEFDRFEWWSRPGLALWGATPFADGAYADELQLAVRWVAPVVVRKKVPKGWPVSYGSTWIAPRDTELAVLRLGYADGFHRRVGGQGAEVLVGGRRANLVGRVCMDLSCVDVTDLIAAGGDEACSLGSDVVVLGRDGDDAIDPWVLGKQAETIAYEVLTSIAARVPKVMGD